MCLVNHNVLSFVFYVFAFTRWLIRKSINFCFIAFRSFSIVLYNFSSGTSFVCLRTVYIYNCKIFQLNSDLLLSRCVQESIIFLCHISFVPCFQLYLTPVTQSLGLFCHAHIWFTRPVYKYYLLCLYLSLPLSCL